MFLTPDASLRVVADFDRVREQYLLAGQDLGATEKVIIEFKRSRAELGLCTLVFAHLRFTGYE